ncbi:MAG: bifunctional oligoribonuclease/PAP phosphatase NrnA [Phycisphaerae bacterium]
MEAAEQPGRGLTNRGFLSPQAVPAEVIAAVRGMRSPIVIAHVVPDADALGSMLAVALALTTKRCRPLASLPENSLSQRLAFLHEWADVPLATPDDFSSADGFIVLDTAKLERCNVDPVVKQSDWAAGRQIVSIDHHATNTHYGNVNWVVGDASSTCEMAYYLLRAAEMPIGPIVASLLYAGMQTDTIGFSLPTTTPSGLRATADVVEAGANVAELGERLWRSQRLCEFQLQRIVYDNTKVIEGGQIAYSVASYEQIHDAGCTAADIDDQINIPRSLAGVRLAMLFTEGNRGKTRLNFRGSNGVTVLELAGEFGGGGHREAAGAVLDCPLDHALARVLPRAIEHIKNFPR